MMNSDKGNTLKHVRYRRSKSSSKKSGGRKSSSHFPRSKSSSSKSGKKKSGSRSSLGDVCYKDSKLGLCDGIGSCVIGEDKYKDFLCV